MMQSKDTFETPNSVLIVCDNIKGTETLNYWFRQHGFGVDAYTSPVQAVSMARVKPYQLILIDNDLQDEIGSLGTAWLLKTVVEPSKIVLMAGTINPSLEKRAATNGVHHWLTKPFTRDTPQQIQHILENIQEETSRPHKPLPLKKMWNRFQHLLHRN